MTATQENENSITPDLIKEHAVDLLNECNESCESKLLESFRVRTTDKIEPPQKAWEQSKTNSTLGTLGNFSLIIGKAKSRKSFFINIVVSTVLSSDELLGQFKGCLPKEQSTILYFDTEQGKYHVKLALNRVCNQLNKIELPNLKVYGLRSLTPSERLTQIEYAINNTPNLGFVVIDGIKDLVTSINDEGEATMIASKLLKWTEEKNIHIVTVLHQNKGDNNARGHIGTELINKAETVLSVTKNDQDKNISIVEAQQCRNREPEPFAFEIDENGLPFIVNEFQNRIKPKAKISILDLDNYKQYSILTEVFMHSHKFNYTSLIIQIKLAYTKIYSLSVGNNKVKEFITHCKNENWLIQDKDKAPYQIGDYKGDGNF